MALNISDPSEAEDRDRDPRSADRHAERDARRTQWACTTSTGNRISRQIEVRAQILHARHRRRHQALDQFAPARVDDGEAESPDGVAHDADADRGPESGSRCTGRPARASARRRSCTGSMRPAARCIARSASVRARAAFGIRVVVIGTTIDPSPARATARAMSPMRSASRPAASSMVGDVEAGLLTQRVGDGRRLAAIFRTGSGRPRNARPRPTDSSIGNEHRPEDRFGLARRTRAPARA